MIDYVPKNIKSAMMFWMNEYVLGAINLPVLNNEQRAEVGTLYCK